MDFNRDMKVKNCSLKKSIKRTTHLSLKLMTTVNINLDIKIDQWNYFISLLKNKYFIIFCLLQLNIICL